MIVSIVSYEIIGLGVGFAAGVLIGAVAFYMVMIGEDKKS